MINVSDLSYTYPRETSPAIARMNFNIPKGEIFGFLGPSGAGKSTTQNVLIGILKDYQGSVQMLGKELHSMDQQVYNSIGVAFERPNFYSKFTALENLSYFSKLYEKPVQNPHNLLKKLGLLEAAKTRVGHFSKGMKMRLNFCRAMLHDPEVLFLDEPTAGLDPVNTKIVKELILEQKRSGKTIIISTHNMHIAEEICDRVAFVVNGTINLIDSPMKLKANKSKQTLLVQFEEGNLIQTKEWSLQGLNQNEHFIRLLKEDKIMSMHTSEPTLEDVFIEVTGRKLL